MAIWHSIVKITLASLLSGLVVVITATLLRVTGRGFSEILLSREKIIILLLALLILLMPAVFSLLRGTWLFPEELALYVRELLVSVVIVVSFSATWEVLEHSASILRQLEALFMVRRPSATPVQTYASQVKTLSLSVIRPNDALDDLDRGEIASINKLIHECVDSYLPKAKARGINFEVDLERVVYEEGKPEALTIRMDRISLRQALLNVLDNAVKYSFDGTADHPRWVKVVGQLRKEQRVPGYIIAVSNLGIGIEKGELELVFEPGYQGKRRLDEDRSGYGMGLTFVKECVERHGGGVAIHSQPQQRTGWLTTLYIWLPIHGPIERRSEEA